MTSSFRSFVSALVVLLVACFARAAAADLPPPSVTACMGKASGAECDLSGGTKGSCQASKCGANDCLECKQGATTTRPDSGTAPATTDDGGCAIALRRRATDAGPWLIALAAPAIAFAIRKRSNRRRK